MKKLFIFTLMSVVFLSCDKHPTIEITKDYIYNDAWTNKKNNQTQLGIRQVFIDSTIAIKSVDKLTGFEIHNSVMRNNDNHIISTSNFITFSKKEGLLTNKIFFSKKNEDIIWIEEYNPEKRKNILGSLKLNTWYLFSYLYPNWIYYVFVDRNGNVHTFPVSPVNI